MRSFISIDLPEEIKTEIQKVQKTLPNFVGKLVEKENLHLTLKFLGEIDEEKLEKIRKILAKINFAEFKMGVEEIGIFSEGFIKIIWVGLSGCEKLQKEIDGSLKDLFKKEERFMGHLTIARVKNVDDKKGFILELKKISVPKMEFKVKNFYLMKSDLNKKGPIYSIIEKFPLKKENTSLK